MKYTVNPDYGYTVPLGALRIHVVSYEIEREKKFRFEPVLGAQTVVAENGTYPVKLKIKGRILKSERVNAEVRLTKDLSENMHYFLNLDRLFFNAARLVGYRTFTDMKSQFIDCEIDFLCESYLEANDYGSNNN